MASCEQAKSSYECFFFYSNFLINTFLNPSFTLFLKQKCEPYQSSLND